MGNEFGHPEWIDFPRKGNNNSFDFCRRQWHLKNDENLRYKFLGNFDQDIMKLDEKYRFLGQEQLYYFSIHEKNRIFFFERDKLILIFNLNENQSFENYEISCFFFKDSNLRMVFDSDKKVFGGHGRVDEAYGINFVIKEHEEVGEVKEFEENRKNGFFSIYLPSLCFVVLELV